MQNPAIFHLSERAALQAKLQRGVCCSLVGPSNSGKSSLVRSLSVMPCPPGPSGAPQLLVLVDCQMASSDESAFFELALRQTLAALRESQVHPTILRHLEQQHTQMLLATSDISIRALFADSLASLVKETDFQLVLILDELDDLLRSLPPWPFRMLRGLYDEMRGRLMLVVVTSRRLERICHDSLVYDFRELFLAHTIHMKPLPIHEAHFCLENMLPLAARSLNDQERNFCVQLSGGHPGLILQIMHALAESSPDQFSQPDQVMEYLLRCWPVQQECQRWWDELEFEEQEWLLVCTSQGAGILDPLQRQVLENQGFLTFKESQLVIFSPLIDAFIRQYHQSLREAGVEGLYCDVKTGQIWLSGKDITADLSELERNFLRYLHRRQGEVCSYDDLVHEVWKLPAGVSRKTINTFVRRLRQQIEIDPDNPIFIETIRGAGYRMVKAPE